MLEAITLDYWDTLYDGAALPERMELRRGAVRRMVAALGQALPDEAVHRAYRAAGAEAERWWRHEQRGYTAEERLRWTLARLGVEAPAGCPHVAEAVRAVDDALLALPPALLPGAADAVRALAARHRLGIVSDTGFASGAAQDRLLARDGLLEHFAVRVYSCDIGHAKPHALPFARAAAGLGAAPGAILHVGDIERTDVAGALAAGFRAVRFDAVRDGGATAAEAVVYSWEELVDYVAHHAGAR